MKKTKFPTLLLAMGMCMTAACSLDQRDARQGVDYTTDAKTVSDEYHLYATLERVDKDGKMLVISDAGDTITLKLVDDMAFLGGRVQGSRLLVERGTENKSLAMKVVNISQLLGEWVAPNPLAEGTLSGIKLQDGGTAQSINSQTTNYEAWELEGNRLILSSSALGMDVNELEQDTFLITFLSADSLRLDGMKVRRYYCRSSVAIADADVPRYERETDMADHYDLFNPEGDITDNLPDDGGALMDAI